MAERLVGEPGGGGAIVSDCNVESSVIGIRAVMRESTIKRSLMMGGDPYHEHDSPRGAPPIGVGRGSVIENAIIDKNVRIGENVRITNEAGVTEAEEENYVIRDGIVVIPHNTVIEDGTVI